MVFINMHSVQFQTFSGNSRSHQFTHPVILCYIHVFAPCFIHFLTHGFCHKLASHKRCSHGKISFRMNSDLFCDFCNTKCIRRCCDQSRRSKILHEHQLLLCISCGRRNDRCSKLLQSIMQTKRTCKHPITETNLCNILRCSSSHTCNSTYTIGPHIQIFLCVSYDCRFSCRSA